ncbi:MAG TPA: protein phosphatase 2C domain-containing protein [Ignavibacteriaceae bacterium]|nr:protein phosphatase 2C domain-containing protein [Ignavibacteriaceae bacterium]
MTSNDKKLSLIFAARSDIGLVRTENQDSFGKFPENDLNLYNKKGQLFIVADGMGGHKGGKEASTIAVNVVSSEYLNSSLDDSTAVREAIEKANLTIHNQAGHSTEFGRMGTTCSVLLLKNETGIIGHVGDSRIYKIENNKIEQLTDDHTKVLEMLREGILTPEEAKNYPSKSVLARALGVEEKVRVDIIPDIQLNRGQSFVLCSDGLGKVTAQEILPIVSNHTPPEACKILVGLANERGGKDNVTVIVVKIDPEYSVRVPEPVTVTEVVRPKPIKKRKNLWPAAVLIILLILLVLFIVYKPSFFSDLTGSGISQNETADQKLSDADENMLKEADALVDRRDYDDALNLYKKILDKEPMHQAALKGVNEIAEAYFSKANNLMYLKRFEEALTYYQKVESIQPENEIVKNRIKLCNSQIGINPAVDSSMPEKDTTTVERLEPGSQITRFDLPGWNYPGTNKNEFTIRSHELDFQNTLSVKNIIYNEDLFDVTLVVSTVVNNKSSSVGLIIGYSSPSDYYIYKHHPGGEYVLQKVQGGETQNLLTIKPDASESPDRNLLKIQYTNNLISIYNENGLLSSYKSIWGIYGKAGLFVDKNSTAKFQNIFLSGKTRLD